MKILYFGRVAEITGRASETMEVPDVSNRSSLDAKLKKTYPELNFVNYQMAHNQTLNAADFELANEDEIALLPAFGGG